MFRKQDSDFADRIDGLIKEFGKSANPQKRELAKFAENAKEAEKRISRTLTGMQESLDYLQVCIKYQIFDLEATRRENAELRKLLEDMGA